MYAFTMHLKEESQMKVKRTIAFILGLGLIGLLFFGYCEFYGNPITKMTASRKINEYLTNHFTEMDYQKSSVKFNFKDKTYYVHIDVKDSEDKDFSISYKGGDISHDYDWRVTQRNNAEARLQVYLNQTTWEDVAAYLYGDNLNFSFLSYNQKAWKQNPPELDTSIEQMLKDYPIELTVYVHDISKYTNEQKEELKKQTIADYEKEGISLSSIEIK